MILLEQHFNQLIRGEWNNQENGASHANHKHPAQDMSHNRNQRIKHIHTPKPLWAFYTFAAGGENSMGYKDVHVACSGNESVNFYDFFMRFLVS